MQIWCRYKATTSNLLNQSTFHVPKWWILRELSSKLKAFWGIFLYISEDAGFRPGFRHSTTATLIINHVIMNIDESNRLSQHFDNGTAGLLISLITCPEMAVPIRIGSISLYFPDCMFGEDRRGLQSGARLIQITFIVTYNEINLIIWSQVLSWGMQKSGGVTVFSCFQNNSYCGIQKGWSVDLVDISSVWEFIWQQ